MAILERIRKNVPGKISDYLDENLIAFLDTTTQEETVKALIDLLDSQKKLSGKDAFFRAIMDREKIVSTGIGIGVAIPHAKRPEYSDFFIAIGILKNQGVDWSALDEMPVRIIFMIGGPDNQQSKYLSILSMITTAIKDEERRKTLTKAKTPSEVLAVFTGV